MRTIRLNADDQKSGIKEIRYDYLKKVDSYGNLIDYYDGVSNFDENYMYKKAKVIDAKELVNNQIDLKVPTDVSVIYVAAIDNASNISDIVPISYTAGIPVSITASPSTDPVTESKITYKFVFSEEVVGFNEADIQVENGEIESFNGSGSVYTAVIKTVPDSKTIQKVSIDSGVCTNVTSTARNFAATISVNVDTVKEKIEVQAISLNKSTLTLNEGEKEALAVNFVPNNATDKTITWSSSNNSVATVDSYGTITAVSAGNAIITATSTNGKTATCNVTVTKITKSVNLDKETVDIKVGQSTKVTAVLLPDNIKDTGVTWSTANSSIATVDQSGNITGTGTGTTIVTATSKENTAVSAQVKVIVQNPITLTANVTSTTYDSITTSMAATTTSGTLTVQLKYREKGTSSYNTVNVYSGGTSYSNNAYTLSGLEGDKDYELQVLVTTSNGYTESIDLNAKTGTNSVTGISLNTNSLNFQQLRLLLL